MATLKRKNKKSGVKDKARELWTKQLGLKIRELRLENNKSQSELAYTIRMDAQNISRLELGKVNPSAYVIKQICEALEVPLSTFYKNLEK